MQLNRFLLVAGAAASLGLTGCGFFGGASAEKGVASAEEPVALGEQTGGADQVAQAETETNASYTPPYGQRRKFAYQYHPELEIYYSPESGEYFWNNSGQWVHGQELPALLDDFMFTDTVRITLNTDQPYTRHEHVLRAHPGYARVDGVQPAFTGVDTDR